MINEKKIEKIKFLLKNIKKKINIFNKISGQYIDIPKKDNLIEEYNKKNIIYKEYNTKIKSFFSINKQKNFYILNLIQIVKLLNLIEKIIYSFAKKDKKILFLGTNNKIFEIICKDLKYISIKKNCFYSNSKLSGGFITNWENFKKKLDYLIFLETKQKNLSKKENIYNKKKIEKLNKHFEGIKKINGFPDLVIFTSLYEEKITAKECKKYGIPTIGFIDIFSNPELVDIGIPVNLNNSILNKYLINLLIKKMIEGYNI